MSINAKYRRITTTELATFQADPDALKKFFGLDLFDDEYLDEPEWDELILDAASPMDDPERSLDISNEWQAIHYILTGERAFEGKSAVPPPLCNVVMGGRFLGTLDVGYGPARFLEPPEVVAVADALAAISSDSLRPRVDADAFNRERIYPGRWSQEDAELILDTVDRIAALFKEAAASGDAMLLGSS